MFDVNQITSTLRGMPDRALQQYAMMNKANPYILSLAVAESNQRKQLRQAAQARSAMPQPKVADAAIASMSEVPQVDAMGNVTGMAAGGLPEDQGIARIPTPNIKHMADGGIAGYGDDDEGMAQGGSMFDFAQRSEPVLRMSGGGEIKRYAGKAESLVRTTNGGKTWFLDVPDTIRDPSVPYYREIPNPLAKLGQMEFGSRDEALQAYIASTTQYQSSPEMQPYTPSLGSMPPTVNNRFTDTEGTGWRRKATGSAEAFNLEKKERSRTEQLPTFAGADTEVKPRWTPELGALSTPSIASGAPTESSNVPAAAPTPSAAPAPVGNLPTNAPSIKQAQDLGGKFFDLKGIKGTLEQQEAQERQDILNEKEARAAKLAAFNKEQGPAMAGYEKLLKGEEMQDATDKEKAGLMSLMKGFLAMAAGESPNAATNIAKGAMVGLGDYGDALKEFKKSAKERNKAMAEIENARRAEAKGDLKDQQASEDKANDYLRASKRHGIDAIISATGKSAEISSGIYKEMLQQSGANARANQQVNAPSSQMQLFGALGGGDIKKGLGVYADVMGPEAKGEQAILAKYAGPQGEIALKMLENSGPDGKLQAQLIRQKLSAAMLTPMSKPTGPVRD